MQSNIKLYFRGSTRPQIFPILGSNPKDIEVNSDLNSEKWKRFNESSRRVYDTNGVCPTIPTVAGGGHTPKIDVSEMEDMLKEEGLEITEKGYENLDEINKNKFVALTEKRTDEAKKIRRESMKNGKDWSPRREKEVVARSDGMMGTITSSRNLENILSNGVKIRRLTPTECMRLQGFPDDWCDYGADGEKISDTQKYKMAGNAVTVTVVSAIIEKLCL